MRCVLNRWPQPVWLNPVLCTRERERETVLTWSTPVHLPLTPVDGRNRLLGKMASWRRLPSILWLLYVFVSGCYGNGSSLSGIGGVIGGGAGGDTFFPDWGVGGGRAAQPTCLDIPRNLSLCHGIRYSKMRLPNLLDHDSMAEVIQQAASWVPLLNVRCHADTQLFLCSLFRYFVLFSSFVYLFSFGALTNVSLFYTTTVPCAWIGPSIRVADSASASARAAKAGWKLTATRGPICSAATNSRWITTCASGLSQPAPHRKVRNIRSRTLGGLITTTADCPFVTGNWLAWAWVCVCLTAPRRCWPPAASPDRRSYGMLLLCPYRTSRCP